MIYDYKEGPDQTVSSLSSYTIKGPIPEVFMEE